MPRVCTICAHPKRNEIDAAIASGEANRRIASRFCLSEAAVRRHRRHAAALIAKAVERREVSLGDDIGNKIEKLWRSAEKILDNALANKDPRLALAAISELKGIVRNMYSMARDAAVAKAASEPVQFQVMMGGKPAKRIPVPPPRPSILN